MSSLFPSLVVVSQVLLTVGSASEAESLTTPADIDAALRKVIMKYYPNAVISLSVGKDRKTVKPNFAAKANSMQFTLHAIDRAGIISPNTHQIEGPKHDGFMLNVIYREGSYGGPLGTPATHREPYWNTFVNEIYNKKADSHLWVIYSYGSRVPHAFHKEVLAALGGRGSKNK